MKKRSLRSQAIAIRRQPAASRPQGQRGALRQQLQWGLLRLIACSGYLTGLYLWFYRWRARR